MGKIIAFAIQKGGVGKTSTTLTVGKELARRGKKVLLIDLDSQASLSQILGVKTTREQKTIQHFLGIGTEALPFDDIVVHFEDIDLLPSNILMSSAEEVLASMDNYVMILKKKLKTIKKNYDYILIDCPPSLHALMKNGVMASDYLVIPVKPEVASVMGVELFLQTLYRLQESYEVEFNIAGILFTMANERTTSYRELKEEITKVADMIGTKLFKTTIRQSVVCSNAVGGGVNVIETDKSSAVAKDYSKFVDELLKEIEEG